MYFRACREFELQKKGATYQMPTVELRTDSVGYFLLLADSATATRVKCTSRVKSKANVENNTAVAQLKQSFPVKQKMHKSPLFTKPKPNSSHKAVGIYQPKTAARTRIAGEFRYKCRNPPKGTTAQNFRARDAVLGFYRPA